MEFVMNRLLAAGVAASFGIFSSLAGAAERPAIPGEEKSGKTKVLEAGATALQSDGPPDKFNIHLVGIHPMKDDPLHQMDVHHFCHQLNEDFAQCALFDGDGDTARLNGVEYIISEKLFESLPKEERQYWHPHNYEILSGTLVGPGLPQKAEEELMQKKMNSYGKTWHIWNTGTMSQPSDKLPLGEPHLAWSLNRDGEVDPGLSQRREKRLGINSKETRQNRADLKQYAKPQEGVDALQGKFNRPTQSVPGVVDKKAGTAP